MSNVIQRIHMADGYVMESYICDTNELHPLMSTKELGIVIFKNDIQIDGMLDEEELKEFIDYLQGSLSKIQKFNSNSKPKTD